MIRVGTVTSMQDELFDVVLISCVRSKYPGFLSGTREANVAVTRGKHLRVIVGDTSLLSATGIWSHIISCPTALHMEVSSELCGRAVADHQWKALAKPPLRYTHIPPPPRHKLISFST